MAGILGEDWLDPQGTLWQNLQPGIQGGVAMGTADQRGPARGCTRVESPARPPSASSLPRKRVLTQQSYIHEAKVRGVTAKGSDHTPTQHQSGQEGLLSASRAPTWAWPLLKSHQQGHPCSLGEWPLDLSTAPSQGPGLYGVTPPPATTDWTGDEHVTQAGPVEFSALGIWNWDPQPALQAV